MNHSKDGIDFIVVSYYKPEYIKILVESIKKYVHCEYLVTVVANEKTSSDEYKELVNFYDGNSDVQVIEGTNQLSFEERGGMEGVKWTTDSLGNKIGPGSRNHGRGLTIGMKNTNNKYVCFLDVDTVFLNEWVDDILPLLEESFFVSNRYDKGIAREMFMIFKREDFKKYDLYPDTSYVDNAGNITKHALDNKLSFVVLKNSAFGFDGSYIGDKSEHILDLPHGEQVYINDTPFFYHYGRGATRDDTSYKLWVSETKKYLNIGE